MKNISFRVREFISVNEEEFDISLTKSTEPFEIASQLGLLSASLNDISEKIQETLDEISTTDSSFSYEKTMLETDELIEIANVKNTNSNDSSKKITVDHAKGSVKSNLIDRIEKVAKLEEKSIKLNTRLRALLNLQKVRESQIMIRQSIGKSLNIIQEKGYHV